MKPGMVDDEDDNESMDTDLPDIPVDFPEPMSPKPEIPNSDSEDDFQMSQQPSRKRKFHLVSRDDEIEISSDSELERSMVDAEIQISLEMSSDSN